MIATSIIAVWPGILDSGSVRVIGTIPKGWLLCDGTMGTPDLLDCYIPCAGDAYALGETGGLLENLVPEHLHDGFTAAVTGLYDYHQHDIPEVVVGNFTSSTTTAAWAGGPIDGTNATHNHTTNNSGGTLHTGDGTAHQHNATVPNTDNFPAVTFDNRPATMVLAFIMKR
jgi:hypothetical protein